MSNPRIRKVTVNIENGLYRDAQEIQVLMGHETMSALISAAVEEYVISHAAQLHDEWREANGLNTSEAKATEEALTMGVITPWV